MVIRIGATLCVLAAMCWGAPRANAQELTTPDPGVAAPVAEAPSSDDATARARALFEQGVAFSRTERWAEALEAFQQSAALIERPSTLLNIATALQRLGRPIECVVAVERYLAISDVSADADARGRASALRDAMLAAIAHVALAILPADARLSIDGNEVDLPDDGRIALDPGAHTFRIERDGHIPSRFTLDLSRGENVSRAVALVLRPSDPAFLEVTTQVVGARIEVDDDVVGSEHVELEVAPGPHAIRVSAEGWSTFDRALVIEAGTRARVDAQLSRPGTCQSVECEPAFWIVGGILLAGAAAAAIAVPFAGATDSPPYGGTAGLPNAALRF